MRRAAKVDGNHVVVVEALRNAGAYEMRKLEIDLLCNEFDLEMGRVNAEAAKKD